MRKISPRELSTRGLHVLFEGWANTIQLNLQQKAQLFKTLTTLTVIFMLILIVCPSLKPRSRLGRPSSFSFSASSSFLTHLKWSWRATFRSKLSDLSPKPMPMNADLPEMLGSSEGNLLVKYFEKVSVLMCHSYSQPTLPCTCNGQKF